VVAVTPTQESVYLTTKLLLCKILNLYL